MAFHTDKKDGYLPKDPIASFSCSLGTRVSGGAPWRVQVLASVPGMPLASLGYGWSDHKPVLPAALSRVCPPPSGGAVHQGTSPRDGPLVLDWLLFDLATLYFCVALATLSPRNPFL